MSDDDARRRRKQRELREARSDKSSYERSKSDAERSYDENSEKIDRLKQVKYTLGIKKGEAKSQYSQLKNYAGDFCGNQDWTGDKFTKVTGTLNNTIVTEYDKYVDRIDEVLDAVCDKITELENKNYQLHGDILHFVSCINSLINKIEKLCN